MNQEQKKRQLVRYKKPQYDLQIYYYPTSESKQTDQAEVKLSIILKTKSNSKIQAYKIQLTDGNVPIQLISMFSSFQIIFDCLKDDTCFQVDEKNGRILLKGQFQMRGKKIQKKYYIVLNKYEISEYEQMLQNINSLEQQVHDLKQAKYLVEQNLKLEYESKFQELAKAHDLIVQTKQQQDLQNKQKESQLINQISELKKRIQTLNAKIQDFSKNQSLQIKRLKSQIIRLQMENGKVKESLEQFQTIRRGYQGRKAHPDIDDRVQRRQIQNQYIQSVLESPERKGARQEQLCNSIIKLKDVPSKPKIQHSFPQYIINCPYINQFNFNFSQNKITFQGSQKPRYLLFNYRQQKRKRKQYQITIQKMKSYMKFGIIQQKQNEASIQINEKQCQYAYSSSGVISQIQYRANQKYININGNGNGSNERVNKTNYRQEGEGYLEGSTVKITIQLDRNFIQWKVSGIAQASCLKVLSNIGHCFVPFVEFTDQGDCIIWRGQR